MSLRLFEQLWEGDEIGSGEGCFKSEDGRKKTKSGELENERLVWSWVRKLQGGRSWLYLAHMRGPRTIWRDM